MSAVLQFAIPLSSIHIFLQSKPLLFIEKSLDHGRHIYVRLERIISFNGGIQTQVTVNVSKDSAIYINPNRQLSKPFIVST